MSHSPANDALVGLVVDAYHRSIDMDDCTRTTVSGRCSCHGCQWRRRARAIPEVRAALTDRKATA